MKQCSFLLVGPSLRASMKSLMLVMPESPPPYCINLAWNFKCLFLLGLILCVLSLEAIFFCISLVWFFPLTFLRINEAKFWKVRIKFPKCPQGWVTGRLRGFSFFMKKIRILVILLSFSFSFESSRWL